MAKMGQPILPMMGGATPVEVEDDSGEEEEEGSIVSTIYVAVDSYKKYVV